MSRRTSAGRNGKYAGSVNRNDKYTVNKNRNKYNSKHTDSASRNSRRTDKRTGNMNRHRHYGHTNRTSHTSRPLILCGKVTNGTFFNPFFTIPTKHTSSVLSLVNHSLQPVYTHTKHGIIFTGHAMYEDDSHVYFKENYRLSKKMAEGAYHSTYRVTGNGECVPYTPMIDEIGYVYSRQEMARHRYLSGACNGQLKYTVDGITATIKKVNYKDIDSVRLVMDGHIKGYVQVDDPIDDCYDYTIVKKVVSSSTGNDVAGYYADVDGLARQHKYVVHREGVTGVLITNNEYNVNDTVRLAVAKYNNGMYMFREDNSIDLSVGW